MDIEMNIFFSIRIYWSDLNLLLKYIFMLNCKFDFYGLKKVLI